MKGEWDMRAITVAVDYTDLLAVTLMYNRHHFEEVWIVTDGGSAPSVIELADKYSNVRVVVTDLFYQNGAVFNKWAALEYGLDMMGRHGWICVHDADVLWPVNLPQWRLDVGCLYTPLRRMFTDLRLPVPPEAEWAKWPLHPQQVEWAGYTQVFHADDPVLQARPWYEGWKHAGGADSFFQRRWPANRKLRPPFEVLHLGESGKNWCGRVTPYLDGSAPPEATDRRRQLLEFLAQRRDHRHRSTGDIYRHERL